MTHDEPVVTDALAREHGLSDSEYDTLCKTLGRIPTFTELGIVSVMWSEHCSYKSSRVHLNTLPTEGERVIQGPGENAGVVDIGDGQAVVFKMESHNHPSFIEPYQGAATGVGGICRDVFTMGARPIALADCLRFGAPAHERTNQLVRGVVAGIAGYGNSFGVPTVAGDVAFDDSYNGNILVNAFCLGLADADRIFLGAASGVGNPVIYVGAKTGRDGIHGATMASTEFGENADANRPAVQVGDPFMEKLLLEACLELMSLDCLVGIQDMGAAGLTSSSVEMAARAGSGIELDLERVPQREADMTPYELMLSESQERMLMVVERGEQQRVFDIFAKWDLDAVTIGRVTDSGRVVVRMNGRTYADLPAEFMAEGLTYERPMTRPAYLAHTATFEPPVLAEQPAQQSEAMAQALLELLGSPSIASKAWVYEQYDFNVRHGTLVRPGTADAGVVRVLSDARCEHNGESNPPHEKGVAISAGCTSRYVYLAPRSGTQLVVAEAYANLVAVGATPLAVTNCLNFGNPEKPDIMWQFAESVRGLGDACRALGTPVVSGNVSLYNETQGNAIKPTPMIAMVGLLDDGANYVLTGFRAPGHAIAVLSATRAGCVRGSLAGSAYLATCGGTVAGVPVAFDVAQHKPVFDALLAMHRARLPMSAHDMSDGGLALALAESVIDAEVPLDAVVEIPDADVRIDEALFGEAPARFIVSLSDNDIERAQTIAVDHGVMLTRIGTTLEPRSTGAEPSLSIAFGEVRIEVPVATANAVFRSGFSRVVD